MSDSASERPTVLVTGAAGSLAQRVIACLHGRCRVIATDFRRRVDTDAGIASYKIDLQAGGFEDVFRHHRVDTVLHIGRLFAHQSTRLHRYNANVLGTRRLLELCLKHEVSQVLIHSTCYVYGASPCNSTLLSEEAPLKAGELSQDLIDAVELDKLAQIWLRKHPEIRLGILRPCNILGPGVRNTMSLLMARPIAPAMAGYSPMMQFLHVDDMADAIVRAFEGGAHGVFNVAPDHYLPYQRALKLAGCRRLVVPAGAPSFIGRALHRGGFLPSYLVDYIKYPVLIDGSLFAKRFDWQPAQKAEDILCYYRLRKARSH